MFTTPKNNSQNNSLANEVVNNAVSYRGFTSIDQEMEREIAMQKFMPSGKIVYTQKSFLLRDRG